MGAKVIIARSTGKTLIPTIRKRSASKEKKGYLKKPGLINIVDSIKAGGGFVGSLQTCNDENRSLVKSKLIRGSIAKNVPVTPHKTRTGKVYSRCSSVFAHKLPRRSQQLPPPTPSSCFNEPLIVKPLKESSHENVIKLAESFPVVSDATVTKSTDIITLVTEEEINHSIINVPNLDDIPEPKALISFNSTINESDTETDKTGKPSVLEAVEIAEAEDPSVAEVNVIVKTKERHIIDINDSEAVEKDDAKLSVENQLDSDERTLITLPKLSDISFTSSAPLEHETPSPESSPLIPRMDPVKIFKQFEGFTPLVFELPSASSSKESIEPEKLKEKTCVEDMCSFKETEKEDAPIQYEPPPKKNRRHKKSSMKKSPQKLLPAEGGESQTVSNGVELFDGKVYATIKKAGKKGIPLKVEVDSSLLVEPKESCFKKPKNESWNGEKRFRWADWTKDKELIDIREFKSDEKYSFRKSTKAKRCVDPYGD